MSQLNIKGIIGNIKARSNVYTPIIEAIVNSIHSIDISKRDDGEILLIVKRDSQGSLGLDQSDLIPVISSIEIRDNGVGFNQQNRDSFDTLYSDLKNEQGGKGFGRFMFLRYFDSVSIESVFKEDGKYFLRMFDFGKDNTIIEKESKIEISKRELKTSVFLNDLREKNLDKQLETIARRIVEKLLIYFINDQYKCPKIILREYGGDNEIVLNDYLSNREKAEIIQISTQSFDLEKGIRKETFNLKIFKIFYPHGNKSKVSLTAHNREVIETPLHNYIPEFEDDFFEEVDSVHEKGKKIKKDFRIKTYVLGKYLDENVSLERGGFNFSSENELFSPFSQQEIEKKAVELTEKEFGPDLRSRKDKKRKIVENYIREHSPWNKEYLKDLDLSLVPFNPSDEIIEMELEKIKFQQEKDVKNRIEAITNKNTDITESIRELVNKISMAEKSELAHYVALRKVTLSLFKKSLQIKDTGEYSLESAVHNIIFPTKSDSDAIDYSSHNLWIIDEKLNFTDYISSDKPLNGGTTERVDVLVFNKKVAFRGENEASNPITIFEFKRPQRDDFVNESSKEDPVDQIVRYVNDIRDGKYKTPKGRDILIGENTPFFGFVVCDFTKKVTDWLHKIKNFKEMPDGKGWFQWYDNNNLYIEVISWDKILSDAEMRNKIFFNKLRI